MQKELDQLKADYEAMGLKIAEMVLVPSEPTEKMFLAFVDTLNSDADQSGGTGSFQMAYAAMINAAGKQNDR